MCIYHLSACAKKWHELIRLVDFIIGFVQERFFADILPYFRVRMVFFLVRLPCAGGNKFANCNDLLIQKDNVHRLSRDKNICTMISDFAFSRHVIIYVDCNQY